MSFWLYHEQMPLCRVRRLVDDRAQSGTVVLALPANLAGDLSILTDELELYEDQHEHLEPIQGLAVRLAGDEVELTIMTMGGWRDQDEERFNDDWLLVDGKPLAQVNNCHVSSSRCPNGLHIRFTLDLEALRRMNYRRQHLQDLLRLQQASVHSLGAEPVGLMVPLNYDGPRLETENSPQHELLRLRHRLRMPVSLDLGDAGARTVTIVGHVGEATRIKNTQQARRCAPRLGHLQMQP
jgi:hypothetical protein